MKDFPILYTPHGGGPLPLLDDPGHRSVIDFWKGLSSAIPRPRSILVISAHRESPQPVVTAALNPELEYDYYGFPEETYRIEYRAPGDPGLAGEISRLLEKSGFHPRLDEERGLDHGVFVPLKLIYPSADIPVVQLSLLSGLDPARHIEMGRALAPLREEGVFILGSGFSFHNRQAFFNPELVDEEKNISFQEWLTETCTAERDLELQGDKLTRWSDGPYARSVHPREEHLLPLHVCLGAAIPAWKPARQVFYDTVMGRHTSAFLY